MKKILPKKLNKGDTIGLLSISGGVEHPERIDFVKNYFERQGYNVIISDSTYKKHRYMAGKDNERLEDLEKFVTNPDINAIVMTRGGYGIIRLLNKIDYSIFEKNPKIICGYSDITALLLMIYKKTGLVTFHGAMANGDFGDEKFSKFTETNFWNTLNGNGKILADNTKIYYEGIADGILWGGNLATITSLTGLDFIPAEKFIFFTEDINEPAYKIDKMFTQLLNISDFRKNISGIVLGEFSGVDRKDFVKDLIYEIANELKIPTMSGFKITHEKDKITIPVGAKYVMDTGIGTIFNTEDFIL